jgi:DNA helicase-2/ATP-dependent DNA helicase PcrA
MLTLNEEQKRAVDTTEGPVLIIAGAGSGKTRVITERIAKLISKGVSPGAILAITFTNKAAKEMRDRIDRTLDDHNNLNLPVYMVERPFVSTFHALGVHIIRENAALIGLHKHFSIYDRADSKKTLKDAMAQANIDPKQFDPGIALNIISRAKGDGRNFLDFKDNAKGYTEEIVAEIWEKYEYILNKEKALDFDDLLVKSLDILEKFPAVRKIYQERWKYIHIDEYQDTNRIQYLIAKRLAELYKNICVVGDADQNIYSWRGATIENILNFEKDYPDTMAIVLEKNYRSTKTILSAANSVIEKNSLRKKKNLYTDNDHGDKIGLIVSYSEVEEAREIAENARNLINRGVDPSEIAVLYRANFQSRALEESFLKKNIPYQLVGVRFFERKEVKDVISYIRASLNRESWADITRIINYPPRGIGKATVAKVIAEQQSQIPEGTRAKIGQFYKLLDDIRDSSKEHKTSELIRFVIRETGIETLLLSGESEDEERLLNVRELASVAAQYDVLSPEEGLEAFLTNSALASDQDDLEKNENAVKLMTVHASKGLEFEYVFIAGLEQDIFPFKHLDEDEVSQAEEEEERRLFYVALTRAKKKVTLSYCLIRTVFGAQKIHAPSEFIEDIEKGLIEEHVAEKQTGAKALFIDF